MWIKWCPFKYNLVLCHSSLPGHEIHVAFQFHFPFIIFQDSSFSILYISVPIYLFSDVWCQNSASSIPILSIHQRHQLNYCFIMLNEAQYYNTCVHWSTYYEKHCKIYITMGFLYFLFIIFIKGYCTCIIKERYCQTFDRYLYVVNNGQIVHFSRR